MKDEQSSTTPAPTIKKPIITTGGMQGMMTGNRGVPLTVPLPFLLTGASAAALFGILLPWILPEALQAPDFPRVLALVHIVTLGWLTMTIMGASLQLIPVIVVAPLRGVRLIHWQYPVFVSGVLLLVSGFWWMQPWLLIGGGSLIILAVIHHVIVIGVTLAHASKHPLTVYFLGASLLYLCIVVGLGLTAALNFQFGFLGAGFDQLLLTHITLGLVGWLSSTLIGVSYTLTRLFALAHSHDDRLGRIVFLLLNVSIIGLACGFLFSAFILTIASGILLSATAWLFAYDYWRLLYVRHRKVLDTTQYHAIAAVLYFALIVPLGVLVALFHWQQPAILAVLVLLALVGWLGQSTIGYLYKIVPFLIWNKRYGPLVGRQKVPLMRDMIHQRWATLSLWFINVGLIGTSLSALFTWVLPSQIAAGIMGVGLVVAAINIVGVLRA
ncbi:MAG: hypothetical protein ABI406_06150 [Ktedonobacteraceae bacterium]